MFCGENTDYEEASPVSVLLFVGALVALFRAFNIDPDEGLPESYRASHQEKSIRYGQAELDDELLGIFHTSIDWQALNKSKLNANNLGIYDSHVCMRCSTLFDAWTSEIGMFQRRPKIHQSKESAKSSVPKPFFSGVPNSC